MIKNKLLKLFKFVPSSCKMVSTHCKPLRTKTITYCIAQVLFSGKMNSYFLLSRKTIYTFPSPRIIRFKNSWLRLEFLNLIIYDCEFFEQLKISDIDHLILAQIFRIVFFFFFFFFGGGGLKLLDVKFINFFSL